METIHTLTIPFSSYNGILEARQRALVLDNQHFSVGDVLILNPFDSVLDCYMNYDATDHTFHPGSKDKVLLASGIIVEVTNITATNLEETKLISIVPIKHFLRRHAILAQAENERTKELVH
ncbi:putative conserved bacteriophage protein [Weissella oryzae SG25]|uniref:Putative conserved bacteriophage protein n=2 Tax=Weissella TaxID=46255 RepID=A0A069D102_WEIOS|nr:putative conserved bacteriophage protein [Weissella oryzae SG25]